MRTPTVKLPRLVQTDATGRRRVLIIGTLLALAVLVVIAFQWGRGNLGLPGGITPDRVTLRERVNSLETELRTVRVELAQRESERVSQEREREEFGRTIGSLRTDVQRLESELGFYRGVVDRGSAADVLKVQQFQVSKGSEAGTLRVRVVLGRPLNTEGTVSGKLRVTFEGTAGSRPPRLGLAEVAGVAGGELPFDFRYFQEIEQIIRLPPGFVPAQTVVELTPARKGVNGVREVFAWTVQN